MVFTVSALFTFAANELTTDKTEYNEGEAIMITAFGDNSDWVGIYKKGEDPENVYSIRWYYVAKEGNTSGTAKNIFDSEYTNRSDLASIPAGEYVVCLFENDTYTMIDQCEIKVSAAAQADIIISLPSQPGNPQTGEKVALFFGALATLSVALAAVALSKRKLITE